MDTERFIEWVAETNNHEILTVTAMLKDIVSHIQWHLKFVNNDEPLTIDGLGSFSIEVREGERVIIFSPCQRLKDAANGGEVE